MVRAPLPPLTKRAKTADGAASDDEDGDKLDKVVCG